MEKLRRPTNDEFISNLAIESPKVVIYKDFFDIKCLNEGASIVRGSAFNDCDQAGKFFQTSGRAVIGHRWRRKDQVKVH